MRIRRAREDTSRARRSLTPGPEPRTARAPLRSQPLGCEHRPAGSGPAAAGIEMAEKIRDGRFELITGAGHWPQWEQRDRFTDVVLAFLAEPGGR